MVVLQMEFYQFCLVTQACMDLGEDLSNIRILRRIRVIEIDYLLNCFPDYGTLTKDGPYLAQDLLSEVTV